MDFLKKIDAIYNQERAKYSEADDEFCCYIDVEPLNQNTTKKFTIKKREKSMLQICDGKQRVYLSDIQIVNCICDMNENDRNWFLQQFVHLYQGGGNKIFFKINGSEVEGCGIMSYPENKELTLYSDTSISYNDFIFVLNFIFSKDRCHEEMTSISNFSKRTMVKYITLIDYYGNKSLHSKKYLESIGYPVEYKQPVGNRMTDGMFIDILGFDISKYL